MLRFLETGHLNARQLLDMPVLRRAIASNTPPKDTSFFRIFDLCMIENWVRHQGNAGPEATAAAPFRAPSIHRHTLYCPGSTGSALSWPSTHNQTPTTVLPISN